MIQTLEPLDEKIVLFGQSCSGKTTFAKLLEQHDYYCFDALFPWHVIETFGMSIKNALQYAATSCISNRFVLDGWHTADLQGEYTPSDAVIYVIYARYDTIIGQYRRRVNYYDEYLPMFKKWYSISNVKARYFLNEECFIETDFQSYVEFISYELRKNR